VRRALIIGAAVLIGATATVASAGDVERGRLLAEDWCVDCHIIGPETPGGEMGPAFASVANREGKQADIVRAWLVDPHPPMPNMSLTMAEIDDLATYIMSQRTARASLTGASPQEVERGRMLAERWCAACHVVGPETPGGDLGPVFEAIANREGQTLGGIMAWLFEPHPPMPDLLLSPAEFRDLAT
jgi:mono/diheme cytochrome c family protein